MVCTNATVTHEKDGSITVGIPDQLQLVVSALQDSLHYTHLCDVAISINGRSFHAHKFLLVALSNFFNHYFIKHSRRTELDISNLKNISANAFELFIQFAYSSKVKLHSLEDVKGLLKLARGLDAVSVKEACCEYLRTKLTGDNCTEILSCAEEFQLTELEKQAKKLMNKRLIELSETYMKQDQVNNFDNQNNTDEPSQEDVEVDVDDTGTSRTTGKPLNTQTPTLKSSKSSIVPSNVRPGATLKVETKAALKGFPILRPRRSRKPALPIQIIHDGDDKLPGPVKSKTTQVEKKSSQSLITSPGKQRDCKMCRKSFQSPSELRDHCKKEHVRCTKCKRLFTSRTHLRNHMVFHNKKGVKRSSVRKKYDCTYCGKQCNYASALKVHLRTHTGQKPFECTFCNQRFTQSINLYRHVLSYHKPNAPKYQCKVCGKEFNVQIYLKSHEITHSKERPFQCEECGALFKRKNDLRSHRRVHSSAKPHQCEICKTCFKTPGDLKTHKQIHNDNKPHPCVQCGKSFKRTGHLNRHMKIHSSEKPFKCESCSAAFNRKENLRNHLRTHTGEFPYRCEECDAQFKHSSSLKAHAKKHWSHAHTNTEVYVVQAAAFDDHSEEPSQQLPTFYQAGTKSSAQLVTLQSSDQVTSDAAELTTTAATQGNLTSFVGTKFLCLQNYHPSKPSTLIPISDIGVFNEAGGGTTTDGTPIHSIPIVYAMPKQEASGIESNTLQAVLINTHSPDEYIS